MPPFACCTQIVTTMVLSILCALGVPSLWGSGGAWIREAAGNDDCSDEIPDGCGCFAEVDEDTGVTQEICVDCLIEPCESDVMTAGVSKLSDFGCHYALIVTEIAVIVTVFCCYCDCHCSHDVVCYDRLPWAALQCCCQWWSWSCRSLSRPCAVAPCAAAADRHR